MSTNVIRRRCQTCDGSGKLWHIAEKTWACSRPEPASAPTIVWCRSCDGTGELHLSSYVFEVDGR